MADTLRIVWNDAKLREVLSGPRGPVAVDLARRALNVESQAKRNASGDGIGPNVVSGRLRDSISWRLGEDAGGLYSDIGTSVFYSIYLERGTVNMRPHPFLLRALSAARL